MIFRAPVPELSVDTVLMLKENTLLTLQTRRTLPDSWHLIARMATTAGHNFAASLATWKHGSFCPLPHTCKGESQIDQHGLALYTGVMRHEAQAAKRVMDTSSSALLPNMDARELVKETGSPQKPWK